MDPVEFEAVTVCVVRDWVPVGVPEISQVVVLILSPTLPREGLMVQLVTVPVTVGVTETNTVLVKMYLEEPYTRLDGAGI